MNPKTNLSKLIERLLGTKAEVYKLGVDVHARDVVVCVQMDGSLPLRPQKMIAAELVALVQSLVAAKRQVHVVEECGPCGYGLHRALEAAGAKSHVIVAETLGDNRRQKTDQLDATALADKLDRHLRGNTRAFSAITVPTIEQEQRREEARLREQLKQTRHQWEARGRSLLLYKGHHVSGAWWTPRRWAEIKPGLSEWLAGELEQMRTVLIQLDTQEKQRREQLEKDAPANLPKAIGALTWVVLAREIRDWTRFKNRRQVSSYTGLCPGVHQSGPRRQDGSINRRGNPRIRHLLIELIWRLVRWQPDYPPVRALVAGVARGAARRKCAVAAARRLAVDLWRLATAQTTPEKLKLKVPAGLTA